MSNMSNKLITNPWE